MYTACGKHKRECDDGACVYNAWWCNEIPECSDGSDERECTKTEQYPLATTQAPGSRNAASDTGDGLDGEFGHMYTSTPYAPLFTTKGSKSTDFPGKAV